MGVGGGGGVEGERRVRVEVFLLLEIVQRVPPEFASAEVVEEEGS